MNAHASGGGAPRRDPQATSRGARHSASARSVVRVAQRVIRREDWGAFELSVSHAGDVKLRVERSTSSTASPPGRPDSSRMDSGAVLGQRKPLTKKERKALQCQRYGILSRFVLGGSAGLLARRVVRRAWSRLLGGAGHVASSESAEAMDTEVAMAPSPAPAAAVSPTPARSQAAPPSPARTRTTSAKRSKPPSPAKGKKSGRKA